MIDPEEEVIIVREIGGGFAHTYAKRRKFLSPDEANQAMGHSTGITVQQFLGGAGATASTSGGGGGSGECSVTPYRGTNNDMNALINYTANLQENLQSNGFMDYPASKRGSTYQVKPVMSETKRQKRFDQMMRAQQFQAMRKAELAKARLAAEQTECLCEFDHPAVPEPAWMQAGLPQQWEKIAAAGPRFGNWVDGIPWERTDWEWVSCFEFLVWGQVFEHDREYEKERHHLTRKERILIWIAHHLPQSHPAISA